MCVYRLTSSHTQTTSQDWFATAEAAWEHAALDYLQDTGTTDEATASLYAEAMRLTRGVGTVTMPTEIEFTVERVPVLWSVGHAWEYTMPAPDSLTFHVTWGEAREYLESEMRYWASEEDAASEYTSSVEAEVGAIFAPDGAQFTPSSDTFLQVEAADGHHESWWIMSHHPVPEEVESLNLEQVGA